MTTDYERELALAAFQKMIRGEEITLPDARRVLQVVTQGMNIHNYRPEEVATFKNSLITQLQQWMQNVSQQQ
jgi:hypothetical protein